MNDIISVLDHLRQQANRDGLASSSSAELENYAAALCHSQAFAHFGAHEYPQLCETVRTHLLRSHIGNLQSHVVELHCHITDLNESNAKIQRWVIALAVAALITAFVQTATAIRAELRAEPLTHSSTPPQQKSVPPLEAPTLAAPPSFGQAKKKAP
ncbi:hypothetical protein LPB67_18140 [Undibacterium sp. Jales W-56]|uniref:hypothetical protein n=1 Tax=Undibacterium sp. Jales W-56 TaxID=2897325 RepID=UPI0021D1B94A|nr:hypothetical protein [Undibacterium sp. Jales W-56]MCU6435702.1 hypothetical protein [Undibacterium sp. Jales W-56]